MVEYQQENSLREKQNVDIETDYVKRFTPNEEEASGYMAPIRLEDIDLEGLYEQLANRRTLLLEQFAAPHVDTLSPSVYKEAASLTHDFKIIDSMVAQIAAHTSNEPVDSRNS